MSDYDVIVIGGGPAGASAATYVARGGFSVCIIDGGNSALFRAERIENYYGTGAVSGSALFESGLNGARASGVTVIAGQATFVSAGERDFTVLSTAGELNCKKLIIATGATRTKPAIDDGGANISYCAVCDAFFYRKKKVGVVGAGEFARHEYETLKNTAESVALFTDGEKPSFAVEPEFTQRLKCVTRDESGKLVGVRLSDGSTIELDGLFIAVGVCGATALAKSMGIFTHDDGSIKTDENGKTNIDGLYAAGDCTAGIKQVAKAVCDGMTAGTDVIKQLRIQN